MTKKPNEPVQQQAVRGRKQPGLKLVSRASLRDDRQSLPIALLRAREAVMQHFRLLHRKGKVTEQQWRVLRVLYLEGEMDAGKLANHSFLLAPSLSRILKDLESAEHIKRRASATDFPPKSDISLRQGRHNDLESGAGLGSRSSGDYGTVRLCSDDTSYSIS